MSNNNISIVNMTNNNEVKPITILKIHNIRSISYTINKTYILINICGTENTIQTSKIRKTNISIDYDVNMLSVINTVNNRNDLEYAVIPNNYLISYGNSAVIRIHYLKEYPNVSLMMMEDNKQEGYISYGLYDFTELMNITNMSANDVSSCFNNPVGFYEYCYKFKLSSEQIKGYADILLQNHPNKHNIVLAIQKLLETYPDKWSEDLLTGYLLCMPEYIPPQRSNKHK